MFAIPEHAFTFSFDPDPEPEWQPGETLWTAICVLIGGLSVELLHIIFKT